MKQPPNQGMSLRSPRQLAGFTLLELMVTLAVLGVLLGIGIPAFNDIIRQNRLASQANELLGAAALARSEAVKRGTPVTLCPVTALQPNACADNDQWSNGWIVFSDGKGTVGSINADAALPGPDDAIIQRSPAPSVQKVGISNAGLNYFSYRGDGGVSFPIAGITSTQFNLVPEGCVNPLGARLVTVIAAGRASATRVDCPP